MFYWKKTVTNKKTLKEELLSCRAVDTVQIAVAFIESGGIKILRDIKEKYNLSNENIKLYLSEWFSNNSPGEMLEELREICSVKILLKQSFHPKVYLLTGKENKLIFGSSNFTRGGFEANIEFDSIKNPNEQEILEVQSFFKFCDAKATPVNTALINDYKKQKEFFNKQKEKENQKKPDFSAHNTPGDPFSADKYDLSNRYFKFEDYETFFSRNSLRNDNEIKMSRKRIQEKMLVIHNKVDQIIEDELDLYPHYRKNYITSNPTLGRWNNKALDWIGVRYGKSRKIVERINNILGKKDFEFPKHGCLQFSVFKDNFNIIFHFAVPHNAIDREYMCKNNFELLEKNQKQIEAVFKNLKGFGFEWHISKEYLPNFKLDEHNVRDFVGWFKTHDDNGYESYLKKSYMPDDPILENEETISKEILQIMPKLKPLYDAMVWIPKNNV